MIIKNIFSRATRKKAKLRLAITGVSGSGKTYSALVLAKGLGGKVAFIDTENCSASLYSHLIDFDVMELSAPFIPEKYIEAIEQAEISGYSVLIIDSLSSAWSGSGGVLEIVDDITRSSKHKNSYMAWNEGSKKQEKLIQKILTSSLHIICCMRSKTAYDLVDNGQGKKVPVKIGLQPIQRDSVEYEFQVIFDLARENHFATVSKDRTNIFGDSSFLIKKDTGKKLNEWLNSGVETPSIPDDFVETIMACKTIVELSDHYRKLITYAITDVQRNDLLSSCAKRKKEIQAILTSEDIPQ